MIGTNLGPYRILAKLGEGGMGEVYRAHDPRLDREVAIKVLPTSLATDAVSLARFEREAKAVAALSHPNILSIFDFGSQDGVHYAVMELLDGITLRDALGGRAMPVRRTLDLAVQKGEVRVEQAPHVLRIAAVDATGEAHEVGEEHRDGLTLLREYGERVDERHAAGAAEAEAVRILLTAPGADRHLLSVAARPEPGARLSVVARYAAARAGTGASLPLRLAAASADNGESLS